jgi:hypothetical protein
MTSEAAATSCVGHSRPRRSHAVCIPACAAR